MFQSSNSFNEILNLFNLGLLSNFVKKLPLTKIFFLNKKKFYKNNEIFYRFFIWVKKKNSLVNCIFNDDFLTNLDESPKLNKFEIVDSIEQK